MLPRAEFDALCDAAGGVELEKDLLLEFLHNIGTVFYRQGLFGDQLILDQAWALNAVYAVFDRERSLHQLRRQGGRFDRALLGALVWDEDEHSLEDQEQFIEFMRTSGMCFELRRASAGFEAEYIAPDLLPEREHPDVQERFTWFDPARVDASGKIAFALLPQGLLRTIMAGVGKQKPDLRRHLLARRLRLLRPEDPQANALVEQTLDNRLGRRDPRVTCMGGHAAKLLERSARS